MHGHTIEQIIHHFCGTQPELIDDVRQEAWLALSRIKLENAIAPAKIVRRQIGWRVMDFLKKYRARRYWSFERAWSEGYRFSVDSESERPVLQAHYQRSKPRKAALQEWLY